jgi:hypothetical protein
MVTETHGVIGQQSKEVQSLCMQFTQSYNKHRKTVAEWGRILQTIRDSKLNAVNSEGESLALVDTKGDPVDVQGKTFSTICQELGVPRSTAYHYINLHVVLSTYPEWLQEAATVGNLNLAARHVQDAFESMRETIPAKPDSLQISGVVAELKKAKAPLEDTQPLTRQEFVKSLAKLIRRGLKSMEAAAVISAVDEALKDSEIAPDEREAVTHAALDAVDKSLGIDTRNS